MDKILILNVNNKDTWLNSVLQIVKAGLEGYAIYAQENLTSDKKLYAVVVDCEDKELTFSYCDGGMPRFITVNLENFTLTTGLLENKKSIKWLAVHLKERSKDDNQPQKDVL